MRCLSASNWQQEMKFLSGQLDVTLDTSLATPEFKFYKLHRQGFEKSFFCLFLFSFPNWLFWTVYFNEAVFFFFFYQFI